MVGKEILEKLIGKNWPFSRLWTASKAKLRVLKPNHLGFKWFAEEITKELFPTRMLLYNYMCVYIYILLSNSTPKVVLETLIYRIYTSIQDNCHSNDWKPFTWT